MRNHRKIAIFDQKRAIVGSHNLENRCLQSSESHKRAFHDFSGIVESPIVATLNRIFISDWCFATKSSPIAYSKILAYNPSASGFNEVKVIAGDPDYIEDPLWEQILTIVQECRRELLCITPYFVPNEVLFRSPLIKAHTGVKIRLITPEKSNQNLVNIARHHYFRELAKAGVEILLYHPKMLHAKLIIADKKMAMMTRLTSIYAASFSTLKSASSTLLQNPLRNYKRGQKACYQIVNPIEILSTIMGLKIVASSKILPIY